MKDLVKIESLTPEQMSERYRVESLSRTQKEIQFLNDRMTMVAKASLVIAFEMGRRLVAVKHTLDHGQFLPWIEENFPSTRRTAVNYMKLYDRFKDEPATLLEDLSLQDAYVMAGIKKTSCPDEEDDEDQRLKIAGKYDDAAEKANMVALFKRPTVSGHELRNHRVENVGGRVWVYRKDVGIAAPAIDLYLGRPQGLPEPDWIEMQTAFVVATELYLAKVEEYEASGVVQPPKDKRLLSVMPQVDKRRRAS
jgi:hypothetical protein